MKLEVQSSRTGRDYTEDAVIHTWLADKLSQSGVFNILFTLSKSITFPRISQSLLMSLVNSDAPQAEILMF